MKDNRIIQFEQESYYEDDIEQLINHLEHILGSDLSGKVIAINATKPIEFISICLAVFSLKGTVFPLIDLRMLDHKIKIDCFLTTEKTLGDFLPNARVIDFTKIERDGNPKTLQYTGNILLSDLEASVTIRAEDIRNWLNFNQEILKIDFNETMGFYYQADNSFVNFSWLLLFAAHKKIIITKDLEKLGEAKIILTPLAEFAKIVELSQDKTIISFGDDLVLYQDYLEQCQTKKIKWYNFYAFPYLFCLSAVKEEIVAGQACLAHEVKPIKGVTFDVVNETKQKQPLKTIGSIVKTYQDRAVGSQYKAFYTNDKRCIAVGYAKNLIYQQGLYLNLEVVKKALRKQPDITDFTVLKNIIYYCSAETYSNSKLNQSLCQSLPLEKFGFDYYRVPFIPRDLAGEIDESKLKQLNPVAYSRMQQISDVLFAENIDNACCVSFKNIESSPDMNILEAVFQAQRLDEQAILAEDLEVSIISNDASMVHNLFKDIQINIEIIDPKDLEKAVLKAQVIDFTLFDLQNNAAADLAAAVFAHFQKLVKLEKQMKIIFPLRVDATFFDQATSKPIEFISRRCIDNFNQEQENSQGKLFNFVNIDAKSLLGELFYGPKENEVLYKENLRYRRAFKLSQVQQLFAQQAKDICLLHLGDLTEQSMLSLKSLAKSQKIKVVIFGEKEEAAVKDNLMLLRAVTEVIVYKKVDFTQITKLQEIMEIAEKEIAGEFNIFMASAQQLHLKMVTPELLKQQFLVMQALEAIRVVKSSEPFIKLNENYYFDCTGDLIQKQQHLIPARYQSALDIYFAQAELSQEIKQKLSQISAGSEVRFHKVDKLPRNSQARDDIDMALLIAKRGAEQNSTSTSLEPTVELNKMMAIWKNILNVETITVYDDFFDLGGNSILISKLLFQVQKEFNLNITFQDIIDDSSINGMMKYIKNSSQSQEEEYQALLKKYHTLIQKELDFELKLPVERDQNLTNTWENKNILITGVTGFLGAFLLKTLLETTSCDLYLLARASDAEAAKNRLIQNMEVYGIAYQKYVPRIFFLQGDLSKEKLGLGEKYEALAATIDIIFHSAAMVSFIAQYDAMKEANIDGTRRILEFAAAKKIKYLHYISTYSVYEPMLNIRDEKVTEKEPLKFEIPYVNSYISTKYVADLLVQKAAANKLPCKIYRIGTVTGDSENGRCQMKDFFWLIIKASLLLNKIPIHDHIGYNLIPADVLADSIVEIAGQPYVEDQNIFNVSHQKINMAGIFRWLKKIKPTIKAVEYTQWYKDAVEYSQLHKDSTLLAILVVLPDAASVEHFKPVEVDCSFADSLLPNLELDRKMDFEIFKKTYDYLHENDFL